jgi:hypothetical protein
MIRFVADEGVDAPIVRLLRQNGFDVLYIAEVHSGVILTRLEGLKPQHKAAIVLSVIQERIGEILNSFTVIQPGAVRIRKF